MRKGPGISALSRHTTYSNHYNNLSNSISSKNLKDLTESFENFKFLLIEFSIKHKKDIRSDPGFRFQFQKLCSILGIDPLLSSSSSSSSSSKNEGVVGGGGGIWNILGINEFEYELTVQLVDICVSTRNVNGGLISLDDLIKRIERLRNPQIRNKSTSQQQQQQQQQTTITIEDIKRCIKILEPLKSGYKLNKIGLNYYLTSIPKELNTDQSILLNLASISNGKLTKKLISQHIKPNWSNQRINLNLIDCLMTQGLAWIDEQSITTNQYIENDYTDLNKDIQGDIWIIAATNFED
ncbi:uncharacterized protein L201_006220 [Kwoniella dendrophila CBS 6074]|uniref:Vacuolar-sorting protein SNF8 n=1 Tax=Kwoniella dendrophila CBS 6074 TaxID=1295534 RepID=A0AAX4K144_9TREE